MTFSVFIRVCYFASNSFFGIYSDHDYLRFFSSDHWPEEPAAGLPRRLLKLLEGGLAVPVSPRRPPRGPAQTPGSLSRPSSPCQDRAWTSCLSSCLSFLPDANQAGSVGLHRHPSMETLVTAQGLRRGHSLPWTPEEPMTLIHKSPLPLLVGKVAFLPSITKVLG